MGATVIEHQGAKLEKLCECPHYETAEVITEALRYYALAHGQLGSHFGIVVGEHLRYTTKPK